MQGWLWLSQGRSLPQVSVTEPPGSRPISWHLRARVGNRRISSRGGWEFLMKSKVMGIGLFLLISIPGLLALAGCSKVHADQNSEAPPPARVVPGVDVSLLSVDHPEQYPLVAAAAKASASELV